MKLDKSKAFGTIKSVDSNQRVFFSQDGIDFDKAGNPTDKKQVRAHHQGVVDEAQKVADAAKAVADDAQAEADAAQALLSEPDAPNTVAKLKEALDEAGVPYSATALKDDLEQLWVDAQAA